MKKCEFGRSMIEMIGVLAIIGVISIGGVWGINKAMTKNTANNLIEDVRLAGFIVVSELFDSLPDDENGLNMAGKFAQNTPYTFQAFPEGETTFEIFVPNVSYNVCMELKQRKVDWLEEIRANGKENVCEKDTLNEISFFFNTLLNGNTEQQTHECRTNKDCPSATPFCRSGICSKCETGLQLNNGTCNACPAIDKNVSSKTTAKNCHTCGSSYFLAMSIAGDQSWCYGCQTTHSYAITSTKNECDRCPNRCWDENKHKCLPTTENDAFNNNGICNYNCPSGTFASSKNYYSDFSCSACPTVNGNVGRKTTAEDCHTCGNNYFLAMGSAGDQSWCFGCQSTHSYAVISTKDECDRCSSTRYWDEDTQKCRLRNN